MKLEDLSKDDKYKIAEFIFAWESDTIIRSEAEDVIAVFKSHSVELANRVKVEAFPVLNMIRLSLEPFDRGIIMKDYYAGKLG